MKTLFLSLSFYLSLCVSLSLTLLTCCHGHILTENIWFVWSQTSYSEDMWRCYRCRTDDDNEQGKIVLLSWMAEFRNMICWLRLGVVPIKFHTLISEQLSIVHSFGKSNTGKPDRVSDHSTQQYRVYNYKFSYS